MELVEFRDALLEQFRFAFSADNTSDKEEFINYVSEVLVEAEVLEDAIEYLPFEGIGTRSKKIQIDGYSYNELDDFLSLYIVPSINYGSVETLIATEANKLFSRAQAFIEDAKYIKEKQGIEVNPESIFDVHCKRLHEYKRQLLKCLHIIYVYQRIKKDPECITTPITFIFAAKAAPGYTKAKEIIRLIHSVAEMVNKDPDMKGKIQVVFVEDYCVSVAEMLIPAADISEQISTAGMEASGTGNMKFMMNGALTIGTMDGANIEIAERVGRENIFIFGDSAEGNYNKKTYHTYNPGIIFENNPWIRDVCNCLIEGNLLYYGKKYSEIYQSLLFGEYGEADPYYVLADFPSYIETYETMYRLYVDQKEEWIKKTVINTAKSGYFSSDRTIEQYNEKIWNLKPVK